MFGLFFMSGTLTTALTPQGSETAPMVQLLGASLGLFGGIALLTIKGSLSRIFSLYWASILPVLFALATLAWTAAPDLTLRRVGSLGLTTAFAFWIAFRFSPKQLFHLVVLASAVIILANFANIQLNPAKGIHQSYDEIAAHHAGSWRGLFGHKNDFGRVIALTASIVVLGFVFDTGGRYGRWLMLPILAIAGLMVLRSNSSQAVLLAATIPFGIALFLAMRRMSPAGRSLLILMALPVAVISAVSAQMIFEYTLHLLGRDATLTGRTVIWEGVIVALGSTSVAGGGYGAGWIIIGPRLTALTGADVGHAHNGFLDLLVDVGYIGVGLTLFFIAWLGARAFGNLMRNAKPELSALALTLVLFSLVGNVAGSFLLEHNSIYWVLLVATFAKLRDAPDAEFLPQRFSTHPHPSLMYRSGLHEN
ncbi:O-antigen ligase family protein [Roseicyclus elongatus]|nr:O-antigen ligase family protein [Roseibacterium elongatum]